jgi:hypothetical protein
MSDEIVKIYQSIANKNNHNQAEKTAATAKSSKTNTNGKAISAGSSLQRAKSENLSATITSIKPVSFVQVRNSDSNRALAKSATQNESSFKRFATFTTFVDETSNFFPEKYRLYLNFKIIFDV